MALITPKDIERATSLSRNTVGNVLRKNEAGNYSEQAEIAVLKSAIKLTQQQLQKLSERYTGTKFGKFDSVVSLSDDPFFADAIQPVNETQTNAEEIFVTSNKRGLFRVTVSENLPETLTVIEAVKDGNVVFESNAEIIDTETLGFVINKLQRLHVQAMEIEADDCIAEQQLEKASAYLSPNGINKFSKLNF